MSNNFMPVERVGARAYPRVGVQVVQPAPAANNQTQLFLYNPAGSGVVYVVQNMLTRVSANVQSDVPQHAFGIDALNDISFVNSVVYLSSGANVPALRVFGRETLPVGILHGQRELSQHVAGSFSHSQVGGFLADIVLSAGSWYAWAPPTGSGIISIEARLVEYPANE